MPDLKPSSNFHLLSYAEASRIVMEQARLVAEKPAPSTERVPLAEAAGRVLAEDLRADRDQPPFPRSTRDGFACRARDLDSGDRLRLIGQIRAGQPAALSVGEREAVEIMTGAPVPAGADCVVMVEHVEAANGWMRLSGGPLPAAGSNIVPRGREVQYGAVVLASGARLSAAQIGVAASLGARELSVFAKPKVMILATGDELVEVGRSPLPHQIRNSNSYSLAALVRMTGGEPMQSSPVADDREKLDAAIQSADAADLLILSGGVSMGKYDFVEEVLVKRGARFFFTGARIQPGKPIVFGCFPDRHFRGSDQPKYFYGLPGNPVSAMVTFLLFAGPLLGALCGRAPAMPRFRQATLTSRVAVKPGLTRFLPAFVQSALSGEAEAAAAEIAPVAWHGSGDLAAASRANCYLVVPEGRGELDPGETVTLLEA